MNLVLVAAHCCRIVVPGGLCDRSLGCYRTIWRGLQNKISRRFGNWNAYFSQNSNDPLVL